MTVQGLFSLSLVVVALPATQAHAQTMREYDLQPIFTRNAQTVKHVRFNATGRVFHDVDLQEADRFDGWTADADLTIRIPYTERWQVRVFWPFYTEGDARLIEPGRVDRGQRIDIRGYGGVFDFANVQLEYQFLSHEKDGFNMAVYGGVGERQRTLSTTELEGDVYNHAGQKTMFGLKADWDCGTWMRFVANAGARYYFKSDDLNPAGPSSSDVFWQTDISGAAIFQPWRPPLFPVAELVYNGDFRKYNSVLFVPELIWGVSRNFELKAGVPTGLTGHGEKWGGRFQATAHF